ncbi:adenylosuccinate lyase [Chloroflexota bacterium]
MIQETPEKAMALVINEQTCLQRWLNVEASLARAQAALGVIPEEVATEISRKVKVELLDLKKYREILQQTSHPMVAMLRVFRPLVAGAAGEYIHLGVTTQDIMDTGTILALKQAHQIIYESLRRIEVHLLSMAEKHANTIMAGRTHSVQALPITFGYKVAIWAREIRRSIQRLRECRDRVFVVQLSGAVGTMAAFGIKGPEIQSLVAKDLDLGIPDISWHASRDRLAEFANLLAIIAGTLWRIAQEIRLLMATEVGEVREAWHGEVIGSSTMPHKINPQMAEQMISLARRIRYNASLVTEVMVVDHERNLEHFTGERETLEDSCLAIGKLLTYGEDMAKNLTVYPQRMRENLDILKGLLLSESVMLELGQKIGKQTAYEIIHEDATKAIQEVIDFKQVLLEDDRVSQFLTEADIDRILNPEEYIGLAPQMARDMVALSRKEREED